MSRLQAPLACLGQALWSWPSPAEAVLCSQCASHTFTFSLSGLAGLPSCPLGVMNVAISREGMTAGYFPLKVAGSQLSSRPRPCSVTGESQDLRLLKAPLSSLLAMKPEDVLVFPAAGKVGQDASGSECSTRVEIVL